MSTTSNEGTASNGLVYLPDGEEYQLFSEGPEPDLSASEYNLVLISPGDCKILERAARQLYLTRFRQRQNRRQNAAKGEGKEGPILGKLYDHFPTAHVIRSNLSQSTAQSLSSSAASLWKDEKEKEEAEELPEVTVVRKPRRCIIPKPLTFHDPGNVRFD